MELFDHKGVVPDVGVLEKKYPARRGSESNRHMCVAVYAGAWLEERGFSVGFQTRFDLYGGGRIYVDVYGRSLASRTNVVMEVKVSRYDLTKSLQKYRKYIRCEKGLHWSPFAEHLFIVSPTGMTKGIRLPLGWGLLEYNDEAKTISMALAPQRLECRMLMINRRGYSLEWDIETFQSRLKTPNPPSQPIPGLQTPREAR